MLHARCHVLSAFQEVIEMIPSKNEQIENYMEGACRYIEYLAFDLKHDIGTADITESIIGKYLIAAIELVWL